MFLSLKHFGSIDSFENWDSNWKLTFESDAAEEVQTNDPLHHKSEKTGQQLLNDQVYRWQNV